MRHETQTIRVPPWVRKHLNAVRSRGYIFNDPFEEKETIEYLINAIDSETVRIDIKELMNLSAKILGAVSASRMLGTEVTANAIENGLNGFFCDDDKVDGDREMILHARLLPLLRERWSRISPNTESELRTRLHALQSTFSLRDHEIEIISFFFMISKNPLLAGHLQNSPIDFERVLAFKNSGYQIAGISRTKMLEAFADKTLMTLDLIEVQGDCLSLSGWCDSYLSGIGPAELIHGYFERSSDTGLAIEDFELPDNEVSVLDLLMRQDRGFNVLFYGKSGTGKTTLAQVLAKSYGRELLSVNIPEDGDVKHRIAAIRATLIFADSAKSLVLIDEADEVLNTEDPFIFQVAQANSWINTLLETYNKKVIWITNRSAQIHPSTMRRFSFSLHFKDFGMEKRLKVLRAEIQRKGMEGSFTDAELTDLGRNYPVNAGTIVNALDTLRITMDSDKDKVLNRLKTILENHVMAVSEEGVGSRQLDGDRNFGGYSLECLNCSEEPERIVAALRAHSEARRKGQSHLARALTILLYGPPGTGKTEFVRYLCHVLNLKISLKRVSDIQSMWVGETERNIAAAFREAADTGSILFFDEADSFLFPRNEARHFWEKSFTN